MFNVSACPSIPDNQSINVQGIRHNARNSREGDFIVKNTSLYKNILDTKAPQNDTIIIKRKLKAIDICCKNIYEISHELFHRFKK